ncbi:translation initiation factor IF-2-like [Gracilinanus agilis]|uniref:translation initiation factor IF-2-like n=1 Tax=Gracilinanus agilis TaxID=191870 RepID=UPI001CFDF47E|nr:translation initiation factor IF-2-like [Gracilinanus agilis]
MVGTEDNQAEFPKDYYEKYMSIQHYCESTAARGRAEPGPCALRPPCNPCRPRTPVSPGPAGARSRPPCLYPSPPSPACRPACPPACPPGAAEGPRRRRRARSTGQRPGVRGCGETRSPRTGRGAPGDDAGPGPGRLHPRPPAPAGGRAPGDRDHDDGEPD